MARSKFKGPFVDPYVIKKVVKSNETESFKPIKIWSRRSTILPDFVGKKFLVYNGKSFFEISVTSDMVAHKFGEFAPTRVITKHPEDKKVKRG